MTSLIIIKIIHISTAIIFIGCVFFRTVNVPKVKPDMDSKSYAKLSQSLGKASRATGNINVPILFVSGLYLFYHYFDPTNALLHAKATLGLLIVILFAFAPIFVPKISKKYPSFKHNFHLFLLICMAMIVILSQTMFY